MADALDRLASRHVVGRGRKPPCPMCNAKPTGARIVISVRRIGEREGKKSEETVLSTVRTLCIDCTAELFEAFSEQLPEPAAPGGRS
jgi:hypothetical protein